jgi:membrane associated rhomboid family serine protease
LNSKPGFPIATLSLIAANVVAAFAGVWNPDAVGRLAFDPLAPTALGAVASLFLHANLVHMLANMVFLAAVGPSVESGRGAARLLGLYLAGGLAGVFAYALLTPRGMDAVPLLGASGAVSACVAFFTIRRFDVRVPLAPGLAVPIWSVTGIWLALQLIGGAAKLGGSGGGVAYWAHLGGLAAGLLWAVVFRAHREHLAARDAENVGRLGQRSPAAALAAAERFAHNSPDSPEAWRKVAEARSALGDRDGEAAALVRQMDLLPESGQGAVILRLAELKSLDRLPSVRRTLLAERFRQSRPDVARALLESVVYGANDDEQRPDALLALANIERATDPEPAKALVRELFDRYPLHPASDVARARGWRS